MRKLPVYLLLDTSGSMLGEPIEAVKKGLNLLVSTLRHDPYALETAWLSIITFSSTAQQLVPLTELAAFQPPALQATGGTVLGAALELTAGRAKAEVTKTTHEQKGDWKPLVFVMTDGRPTDDLKRGLDAFRQQKFGMVVACAAGQDAHIPTLQQITPCVVCLDTAKSGDIQAFFKWVSASVSAGSMKAEEGGAELSAIKDLPPLPKEVNLVPPDHGPGMDADLVERACVFVVTNTGTGTGTEIEIGTGTGFFVAAGHVATNQHVVKNHAEVQVSSKALGGLRKARVLATDSSGQRDYAVLRVDMPPGVAIEPLVFAAGVKRADSVGAWGFPGVYGGIDPSYRRFLRGDVNATPEIVYTSGVVSSIVATDPHSIMHTATISPGNSGGPLVNARGEVLGINTSTYIGKVHGDKVTRETFAALSGQDLLAFLRKHGVNARSR